ncbi:IS66 family transposase [Roseibium album]|uniref:IS66 family transposase n=1 Tax=Roseibium album TaxID=311410 RepID=UPI003CD0CA9B
MSKPIDAKVTLQHSRQLPNITLRSHLAQAIRSALDQMLRVRLYGYNGFFEIDKNTAERAVKPIGNG